jgi:hypothetical protein
MDEGSNITINEFFKKMESDISEIDKSIFDVQTLATSSNKDVTDPALEYLKTGQELLRSLLSKDRKLFSVNLASDAGDPLSPNYITRYIAYRDAKKEYFEATSDFLKAVIKMKEAHTKVILVAPSDLLTDPKIFDLAIEKYKSKLKTS